jgi:hypothetical protein
LKELRQLWLVGVILAVVFLLILQTMLGWSWDPWTIGLIAITLVIIAYQWYRRFPGGH